VASNVTFDLEFRSHQSLLLELYDTFFRGAVSSVIAQHGTNITAPSGAVTPPVDLDQRVTEELLQHLSTVAVRYPDTGEPIPGASHKLVRLPSGAGHDAAVFQERGIPTGMIFTRNEHGSHNPNESMRMDDFMMATELLCRAMGCSP
jgi:N-carbamoyl-L-amino-acid hydrolase